MHLRRALRAQAGAAALVACASLGFSCSGTPPAPAPSPAAAGQDLAVADEAPVFERVRYEKPAPMSLTTSDGTGLRLVRLSAQTVVEDPLSYTELHLSFENPEDRVLEGRFRIALPEGAAVSRFAMKIGESWQEGEVLKKQTARRTYEDFLHRRQDPALLEQGAGNEFAARVFPIPPRASKELIISYAQRADGPTATLVPLEGLPAIDAIDVAVTRAGERAPAQQLKRASYTPTADISLDPSLRTSGDGLRSGEIALVRVRPWGDAAPDPLGSALVLVDSSASRALDFEHGIALAGEIISSIAKTRGDDTPVSVATFDQTTALAFEGPAGSFGQAEREKIAAQHALGASDLEGALSWAASYLAKQPRSRVVFVTDGVATAGDDEGTKIAEAAAALAKRGVERIDAVSLGGVRDSAMLKHLVTAALPRHGVVVGAGAPTSEIASRLSKATRSGVGIDVEGASWWFPKKVDGVQPGDEIAVFATLAGDGSPRVKIDGKALPAPKLRAADRHLVRQAWARARIDGLLEQERTEGRSEAIEERIAALSMSHRVLSPYTSLLVLETQADYDRYGIDRTKLGDILAIDGGKLTTVDRAPPPAVSPVPAGPADVEAGPAPPRFADADPLGAKGNMWGDEIGESFGAGGLGLTGIGEGGGGRGEGIGLGSIGTIGHGAGPGTGQGFGASPSDPLAQGTGQGFGSGHGRLGGAHRTRPPQVRMGATEVSGRLPPEVIQRIVRQNFGRFRACYERALAANPNLTGRIAIRFVIGTDGTAKGATVQSSELGDAEMASCITGAFAGLTFPVPEGGIVTVTYPLVFTPSGSEGSTAPPVAGRIPEPPAAPKPADRPTPAPYTGSFGTVMAHVAGGRSAEALAAASKWRAESPGDVLALLALGEALESGGHKRFAARAYGSIIDMYSDRADLRRYAGSRLDRLGTPDAQRIARDTYDKARRDRPDHPSSHRLLAFAELRIGHHEKAFDALTGAFEQSFRAGNFGGVEQILREDLGLIGAAWIKAKPEDREYVMARLDKAGAKLESDASMRIVMTWETDANDVDLHVYDDRGGHAFYSNPTLEDGGKLYADVTTGFGPECFTVRKAEGVRPAGNYEIFAHYYRRGPMGYGMGKAHIVHHDGQGGLAFEDRPFVVMADDAYVSLGKVAPRFK